MHSRYSSTVAMVPALLIAAGTFPVSFRPCDWCVHGKPFRPANWGPGRRLSRMPSVPGQP
ncbi:hypothetical protein ARTHRO9AX_160074 [Arthrobacter sp. 9AX]|nr:hypothetical protein ARTHRO9AX_160074 [Arthrobacter sp. 9AX]